MAKFLIFVAAAALGAAATLGLIGGGYLPGFARTASAPTSGAGPTLPSSNPAPTTTRVVALARLEPSGGIIELGGVPGDKIEQLLVHAGQTIKRNDELIRFESRTLRELEQAASASQHREATTRLQAEQAHADSLIRTAQLAIDALTLDDLELTAQRTRIKALEAGAKLAHRDFERLSRIDADVRSSQELEHAQLQVERADIELAAAQEEIKKLETGREMRRRQAEAGLEQAKSGRAKVDAAVPLESLKIAVAAADERLRLAVLRAPFDGVILETLAESGDTVGPTPLLRLADVSAMIARAEVFETQVSAVRIGQKCTLTADALTTPLTGVVERISTVVGHNRLVSLDPRRSTDDRIVEVRIRINEPAEAARFVNLQTTVTIDTGGVGDGETGRRGE